MTQVVKPLPFDHKSKMRLIEHGPDWRVVVVGAGSFPKFSDMVLLQSVKTDYLKWWKRDHANVKTER